MREEQGACFGRRIDIHIHLTDPLGEPSDQVLQTAIRLARHHGIERLVLLCNLTGLTRNRDPSPELVRSINTYTLATVSRHPDVFIGFCYLNPANPPAFIQEEMGRCIVRGGMKGVKLWTAVKATDSRLDLIMSNAQAFGVPVLHHASYKQTAYSYNESTPAEIANLGRRFPQATIVMAHLGGGGERGVLDLVDVPNVLVDTSGWQPEAVHVEYAVRQLGARRVMYGSDYPIRDFGVQIGRVLGARISPEEKELILRGNAARILGLMGDGP